jgi:hypothetical protein
VPQSLVVLGFDELQIVVPLLVIVAGSGEIDQFLQGLPRGSRHRQPPPDPTLQTSSHPLDWGRMRPPRHVFFELCGVEGVPHTDHEYSWSRLWNPVCRIDNHCTNAVPARDQRLVQLAVMLPIAR